MWNKFYKIISIYRVEISLTISDKRKLGMGCRMDKCRYRYGSELCAHNLVEDRACVGECDCQIFNCFENAESYPTECLENSCEYDKWYGLYCAKYKRFYCPGAESCDSIEEYMKSFADHRESLKR